MLYVFLLKTFKAWIFEKIEVMLLAELFHKQQSFLNGSNEKYGFPQFFASHRLIVSKL